MLRQLPPSYSLTLVIACLKVIIKGYRALLIGCPSQCIFFSIYTTIERVDTRAGYNFWQAVPLVHLPCIKELPSLKCFVSGVIHLEVVFPYDNGVFSW